MIAEYLLNIWIVVLLLIMFGWDQKPGTFFNVLIHPLKPYILWSGLWHCWNMFAPNVYTVSRRAEVVVLFANGESAIWPTLDQGPTSLWDDFYRFRWRKTIESSLGNEYQSLRQSICQFGLLQILERCAGVPGCAISEVLLVQVDDPIFWPNEAHSSRAVQRTVIYRMTFEPSSAPKYT